MPAKYTKDGYRDQRTLRRFDCDICNNTGFMYLGDGVKDVCQYCDIWDFLNPDYNYGKGEWLPRKKELKRYTYANRVKEDA